MVQMSHDSGIDRLEYLDRLPAALSRKQIEVIVGGRRMGKTTLLKQFIKRLMQQGTSRVMRTFLPCRTTEAFEISRRSWMSSPESNRRSNSSLVLAGVFFFIKQSRVSLYCWRSFPDPTQIS
jgi:GTPase SAR1 family protein